jgi:hypothetical protein
MRVHRRAIIFWITRQEIGIDAATGVELREFNVYLLVESDLRADNAGAKRGTAGEVVGRGRRRLGRRQRAIIAYIIECTGRTR